jgi:hypothetical protein
MRGKKQYMIPSLSVYFDNEKGIYIYIASKTELILNKRKTIGRKKSVGIDSILFSISSHYNKIVLLQISTFTQYIYISK